MKKPSESIKRGGLYFYPTGPNESQVMCTLGPKDDPESETVFQVDRYYLADMVAGLTAIKNNLK